MLNTNIIYSEFTKESLNNYYKDNFLTKDERGILVGQNVLVNKKRWIVKQILRYIFNIGYWGFIAENLDYIFPSACRLSERVLKGLFPQLLQEGAEEIKYIMLFIIIVFFLGMFFYMCFLVMYLIYVCLFPINHRRYLEDILKKQIKNEFSEIFDFQELLKTNNVEKITTDGFESLTIEYLDDNSLFRTRRLDLGANYKKTVKDDCLDFSWIDYLIISKLRTHKYPVELSVNSKNRNVCC